MADKEKYEIEVLIRTSPKVLYNMISTPSGLSEWFADDVNLKNDNYIFVWEGAEEIAELISSKQNEYVRFQWEADEGTDYFFELRIRIDSITKEVALIITDHAEPDEMEESKNLWMSQMDDLKRILGS